MPARSRRGAAPEDDARIKRQELVHGVYNFRDVWNHYKRNGWTTRAGGELGYDHYYIKPGKSVKHDVENVDYFYGEAALVAFGLREKIFGDVPVSPPRSPSLSRTPSPSDKKRVRVDVATDSSSSSDFDVSIPLNRLKRRHESSSNSTSNGYKHKRRHNDRLDRRRGSRMADAITIDSSSEDDDDDDEVDESDESDPEFRLPPAAAVVKSERAGAWSSSNDDASSTSSDDSSDNVSDSYDSNDDDIVVVSHGPLSSNLRGQKFCAKKTKTNTMKRATRPLLKTSKQQRKSSERNTSDTKRSHATQAGSARTKAERRLPAAKNETKKATKKNEEDSTTTQITQSVKAEHDSRAPKHKASTVRSISASANATQTPSTSKRGYMVPSRQSCVPDAGCAQSSSNAKGSVHRPPPPHRMSSAATSLATTGAIDAVTTTTTHLALDSVVFPSQPNRFYRIAITSAAQNTTIALEELATHKQYECTFTDIRKLDDHAPPHEIPAKAILEALVRCLFALERLSPGSSPPSSTRVIPSTVKMPTDDLGRVDLVHPDTSDASVSLELLFPCYEFWQQRHRFTLSTVAPLERLEALTVALTAAQAAFEAAQTELKETQTRADLLATECAQLQTLVRVSHEKEHARERIATLQHAQLERAQHEIQQLQAAAAADATKHEQELVRLEQQQTTLDRPSSLSGRDALRLFVCSDWMATMTLATTERIHNVAWTTIVESADRFVQVVRDAASSNRNRVVEVVKTGTYQLNVCVAHDSSMRLWVLHERREADRSQNDPSDARSSRSRSRSSSSTTATTQRIEPTVVQLYDHNQRVSRVDRVVDLSAGDRLSVRLFLVDDANGCVEQNVAWLKHFVPQSNKLFVTYLAAEHVYLLMEEQDHGGAR